MKTMLVTGGAGFIGSNFIHYIHQVESDFSIINLDLLTYAGNLQNLKALEHSNRYQFVEGDIRDQHLLKNLFEKFSFDVVVHFAAESHVDRSIQNPSEFITTNVLGTFELLNVTKDAWGNNFSDKKFHYVSTDEIFGSLDMIEESSVENSGFFPRSPYSASKAAGNHLVNAYFHTYDLPITISNCTNNYGPFQYPEKLIPLIIINCLQGNPLPIYGDGQQVRDWLYVKDHCSAIYSILKEGQVGESYNVGGGNQTTNLNLVKQICTILDEKYPQKNGRSYIELIKFVKDRPGHDQRYDLNYNKLSKATDWQPSVSFDAGLKFTISWYLKNMDWVSHILNNQEFENWIQAQYSREFDVR